MSPRKGARRPHARPAPRPHRVSHSLVAQTAAAGPPAPGFLVSFAGRTFYLTDLAMAVFVFGWLTYIMVSTRSTELIASDDAFIGLQYAGNLARGYRLVFDPLVFEKPSPASSCGYAPNPINSPRTPPASIRRRPTLTGLPWRRGPALPGLR